MFLGRQIDKENTGFGADGGEVVAFVAKAASFRPNCLRVPISVQCLENN